MVIFLSRRTKLDIEWRRSRPRRKCSHLLLAEGKKKNRFRKQHFSLLFPSYRWLISLSWQTQRQNNSLQKQIPGNIIKTSNQPQNNNILCRLDSSGCPIYSKFHFVERMNLTKWWYAVKTGSCQFCSNKIILARNGLFISISSGE